MKEITIVFGIGKDEVIHVVNGDDIFEILKELKENGWETENISMVNVNQK